MVTYLDIRALFGAVVPAICLAGTACAQAVHSPVPAVPEGPKWLTLGTGGGPILRQKRSEPANVLLVNGAAYMFDTGAGAVHRLAQAKVPLPSLRAVFISHHHIDHNADLAPLLLHRWLGGKAAAARVAGPPGTQAMVAGIFGAFRPTELAPVVQDGRAAPMAPTAEGVDLPLETPVATEVYRDENVRVLAVINTHFHFPAGSESARLARSYAYRVETPGRTYVYTGDTGPSHAVTELAKGADVLLSEVIDPVAMEEIATRGGVADPKAFMHHMLEDHLTPDEVGQMAAEAGVKEVVLTHLVPGFDNEMSTNQYSNGVVKVFRGQVHVAADGDRF